MVHDDESALGWELTKPEMRGGEAVHEATAKDAPERMKVAGRMGRWSAAHWKTATLGWLALVVAAPMAGSAH